MPMNNLEFVQIIKIQSRSQNQNLLIESSTIRTVPLFNTFDREAQKRETQKEELQLPKIFSMYALKNFTNCTSLKHKITW